MRLASLRRGGLATALSIALLTGVGIAAGWVLWVERDEITSLQSQWSTLYPWLLCLRCSLFLSLMIYWHEFVAWLGRVGSLGRASRIALQHWRPRAALGLIVIDLVLVEGVVGRLTHAFG